jgi:predicted Zn-dependent protease
MVVIGCGVVAAIVLLCCAGGGLLFWREGASDLFACSDLTTKGEYKQAIPPCRAVIAKQPRSELGHNNLGWCLALDGQLKEGLVESREAVELQPNRSSYDTLAMALALSGQGKEALQIETEHVMIDGDVTDNSQRATLGMVYYAVGRNQDAYRQWEMARNSSEVPAQKLATELEAKYPLSTAP